MNKVHKEKSIEEKVILTLPNEILTALDRYIDSTRCHNLIHSRTQTLTHSLIY